MSENSIVFGKLLVSSHWNHMCCVQYLGLSGETSQAHPAKSTTIYNVQNSLPTLPISGELTSI